MEESENKVTAKDYTTKGFKVDVKFKEKLENLFKQSGLPTQEDFLVHMAELVELNLMREGAAGYTKQITQLEYHSSSIVSLFLAMLETEAAERLQLTEKYDEKLTDRGNEIIIQERELSELRNQLKQNTEELNRQIKENTEMMDLVEQLRENSRKNDLLVENYKEKNDSLNGLLADFKAAAEENKVLTSRMAVRDEETAKQAEKIEHLEAQLANLQRESAEQLERQEERNSEAIEHLRQSLELQHGHDLLNQQSEYQAKIEKFQAEATERLQLATQESTAEIRRLYELLDQTRSSTPKASAPKSSTSRAAAKKATAERDKGSNEE
ncbi:hypothetical protein [Paenibacillus kribbensis]|uniref:hypothetical protein n=1 Tax=Paenibacillus kribbensis TaxID=172713 RepID=UPI0008388EC9|nr:hypothetical protein [Paenibacillus kribbensis]